MSVISRRCRRAFTLVEMLIAMALTLILVYAIAEFYAYVGNTVKDGRAMIEMNGQMRIATARLKADLELLTVLKTVMCEQRPSQNLRLRSVPTRSRQIPKRRYVQGHSAG